jgi:hypothetical protein
LEANSNEINLLIKAYRMVDELEKSAIKLAQSEREEAWREMAKQVARNQVRLRQCLRYKVFSENLTHQCNKQKMNDYSDAYSTN